MVTSVAMIAGCTAGTVGPLPATAAGRRPTASAGKVRRPVPAYATLVRRVGNGGDVESRVIPGSAQHFAARPAIVWLPPALRRFPRRRLPVVVMVHGVPGGPSDWITRGRLRLTADRFAAAHGGVAPLIVMPDVNGLRHTDTECVRTPTGGDVFAYLQRAVPAWVIAHLPADPNRRHWAIGGLSSGGTCAAVQALNQPSNYRAFADFSGLEHPTLGAKEDSQRALRELFGGSQRAFDQQDPLWLSHHRDLRHMSGWFECGQRDAKSLRAQAVLAAAETKAGAEVTTSSAPGRHMWTVWAPAFAHALPWLWARVKG